MISLDFLLLLLILLSGFYMATSIGANDVANAMGTSVGSGALRLSQAVCIAATLEFTGALLFGSHVSTTVQRGIVSPDFYLEDPQIFVFGMFAALLSAGTWLQIASYFGWPVSTTHSIVGSIVGFGLITRGSEAVQWDQVAFITSAWIVSPLLGGLLAYFIFNIFRTHIFYTQRPLDATKQLIPFVVFVFVSILSLLLTERIFSEFSFFTSLLLSLGIGTLAGVGTCIFTQRTSAATTPIEEKVPAYPLELAHALRKARKHLLRVQAGSTGDMHHHASLLVDEVETLSQSVLNEAKETKPSSEHQKVENLFRYLQILSASTMAFAHGANDVANAIGPLAAAVEILKDGEIAPSDVIPKWALALGGAGIVFGLAFWGWRVIETIGKRITELTPSRGFSAEFGTAVTVLFATRLGLPISTTHTLVGAVIGVGLARGIEAINLGMAREIALSWVVTVPAGGALAALFFSCIDALFG